MANEVYPSVLGITLLIILLFFLFALVAYIYQSLTLYYIARKTKTENEWLAWIPIGNLVLMAKIAKMHWWPVLLYIPMIFFIFLSSIASIFGNKTMNLIFKLIAYILIIIIAVYIITWLWKIYEKVSRPGYWAVIPIIISIISTTMFILGLVQANRMLFWFGIIGIIIGILQQYVYMGIAAWHKDSVVKKIKVRNG